MSAEEEALMETSEPPEPVKHEVKQESGAGSGSAGNENFVVLDMAGDSEESDKDDKSGKEMKEKPVKPSSSDATGKAIATDHAAKPTGAANPNRVRKKPKAPVVDVNSLRKRKWQLKVYPLHAEDLQISYMSILCKLASESLLYIPSEGRHGKAELYVATQKETAAIIGKLLRMAFHHEFLSIEVVRKDTGGKEDGDEAKKECKAFLMFDKFLSKKIFDAKGEKGMLVEKIVTLNKLPKAATKDFIGALFPFATDIEIIENDNPDERKATVKCKTPVTSLLVYKSFKRLEINDVHVKLSVDDSVKSISLPPMFFVPQPENKQTGQSDSNDIVNKSSLPRRPMPVISSLNRRVQQIKKRAILSRRKPTRGQLIRAGRPNGPDDVLMEGPPRAPLLGRPMMRRPGEEHRFGGGLLNRPGAGMRDGPMGPGRRRLNDRLNDRRNRDRDSRERKNRRDDGDRHVTKEMLQLQNQLNQAIKNQIAMLNNAQSGGSGPMRPDNFSMPSTAHRAPLLGHGPRHFGTGADIGGMGSGPRGLDHQPEFGGSWSGERNRLDRGAAGDRGDNRARADRLARGGPSGHRPAGGGMDRPNTRPTDRAIERDRAKRTESGVSTGRQDNRARADRSADRGGRDRSAHSERDRNSGGARSGFGNSSSSGRGGTVDNRDRTSKTDNQRTGHHHRASSRSSESGRSGNRDQRTQEYSNNNRSVQRPDNFSSATHAQSVNPARYGDYSQNQGDSNTYYRRY